MKCGNLGRDIKDSIERIVHCEQFSRNANLEIKGVAKVENENLSEVLSKICKLIGEPIAYSGIGACHRVPTHDPGKSSLIAQFRSRRGRDSVLEKAKKKRLSNVKLALPGSAPVFTNEHLCPALKRRLGMAISRMRQSNWRNVWVRNGKSFTRRSDDRHVSILHVEGDDKVG